MMVEQAVMVFYDQTTGLATAEDITGDKWTLAEDATGVYINSAMGEALSVEIDNRYIRVDASDHATFQVETEPDDDGDGTRIQIGSAEK